MATREHKTNRQQVIDLLRENPQGLSKSKLQEAIGGNRGVFRRLMMSMERKGEIVVNEEDTVMWGITKFVSLPE